VVRGELDDALARLARREELQRRRAGGGAASEAALDEVAEALRHVVAQHPGLAVTATVTDAAGSSTTMRVAWSHGSAAVVPSVEPVDEPRTDARGGTLDEPVAGRAPYAWPMTVRTVPPSAAGDPPVDNR
jgi:hypothetical protein